MRKRDLDRQSRRFAKGFVSRVDIIEETASRAGVSVSKTQRLVNAIFLKHFEALAETNETYFCGLGKLMLNIIPIEKKHSIITYDRTGKKTFEPVLVCNAKFKVKPKFKVFLSRHFDD